MVRSRFRDVSYASVKKSLTKTMRVPISSGVGRKHLGKRGYEFFIVFFVRQIILVPIIEVLYQNRWYNCLTNKKWEVIIFKSGGDANPQQPFPISTSLTITMEKFNRNARSFPSRRIIESAQFVSFDGVLWRLCRGGEGWKYLVSRNIQCTNQQL